MNFCYFPDYPKGFKFNMVKVHLPYTLGVLTPNLPYVGSF